MSEPTGIGFYIRSLSERVHGTPKQAAKKARDHGVSFVAIMTMWQEYKKGKFVQYLSNGKSGERIKAYAEAFTAAWIDVYLWGFPWGGHEEAFVQRFLDVTDLCGDCIKGWLYDPELGYKWSTKRPAKDAGMRKQPEYTKGVLPIGNRIVRKKQAKKLVELSTSLDVEDLVGTLGITSYGMAQYHRNFPWTEFGVLNDFGSPQYYTVGPEQIDKGIDKWKFYGWDHIVVSAPTFGKNDGPKLHDYLSNFVDCGEDVHGIILWSWRQTSRDEWRIVNRMSNWFEKYLFEV
jgi:hypothetical protein